jgi:RND family efflux transporter MFP subunit
MRGSDRSTPIRWVFQHRVRLAGCLVAILLASSFTESLCAQERGPGMTAASVVAGVVEQRDVVIQQRFVGTVKPRRTSTVGSPVEGRVVEFFVREGDYLEAGQTLVQLRVESLEIELAGAKAQLELLRSELEDLRISQPKEVKQAEARMRAAAALRDYAQRRLLRGEDLVDNSAITKDQLEEITSAATTALHVQDERTAAWELTVAVSPLKMAQAETRIRVQQERIRRLEDDIAEHTIAAPFDGYVTKEYTEVGQWIAQGGPVVDLVELKTVEIEVPVLETYVSELKAAAGDSKGTKTLKIEIEALPGEVFVGEVVSIVPEADVQSRSFPVNVRLENRPGAAPGSVLLKPGMFARVSLPVRVVANALLIPKDALVLGKGTPMVWVVMPSDSAGAGARIRPVTVEIASGISAGEWVQVRGPLGPDGQLPLTPGELIITEGNERVNPQMMVNVVRTETFEQVTPR